MRFSIKYYWFFFHKYNVHSFDCGGHFLPLWKFISFLHSLFSSSARNVFTKRKKNMENTTCAKTIIIIITDAVSVDFIYKQHQSNISYIFICVCVCCLFWQICHHCIEHRTEILIQNMPPAKLSTENKILNIEQSATFCQRFFGLGTLCAYLQQIDDGYTCQM